MMAGLLCKRVSARGRRGFACNTCRESTGKLMLAMAAMAMALVLGAAIPSAQAAPSANPSPNTQALKAEITRLAAASDGVVGVAVWPLGNEGRRAVLVHADERFPMASTFKVAVAGAVLEKVDQGKLSLDHMISISPDSYVESDVIASHFIHPGVSLSVYNLLEVMLTESDNTAADARPARPDCVLYCRTAPWWQTRPAPWADRSTTSALSRCRTDSASCWPCLSAAARHRWPSAITSSLKSLVRYMTTT